jgi:hypothetical protein
MRTSTSSGIRRFLKQISPFGEGLPCCLCFFSAEWSMGQLGSMRTNGPYFDMEFRFIE